MRLAALAVSAALLLGACGDDGPSAAEPPDEVTVAFLRAVAGRPSTEPAFVAELRTAGFVEGRNLTILAGDVDEAYPEPEAAAAAVAGWEEDGVDLIVALSSSGARVAAETAPDTPILFLSTDPMATGLVEDEQRPEANLTGATFRVPADRTLSLARRAVPGLTRIGLAYPPADPAALAHRDAVQAAADELGMELVTAEFTDADDAAAAVDELADEGVGALLASTSPVATRALPETESATRRLRLPLIASSSVAEHFLLSFAPDTEELGRQLGRQAARILQGADPSSVPVEDPSRFLLRVSATVAAELGLTLPPDLVREANEVIG
jgi:putative ABC transport system substrate-binding protein